MTACIIGWAHTPFGRLDAETVESLIVRAATDALADAGVAAGEVDEIVLGHFNAGFSAQDFTASLVLQASPDLRFKRATRVENACATGSAAVHQGLQAIKAGAARIVLVVGVEQMTTTPPAEIGRNLLKASYVREEADIEGGFAGIFGQIAARYFQKYGDQSDALALIAAKNHKNGVANPYAQMRKDLGFAFCRTESEKNPFVAGPLKRTDCSLVSDGAAALVLADVETALAMRKAVIFRAAAHVQDFLPMSKRDILKFEGCGEAWRRALAAAGIALGDLSFVETHDCFTIAELLEYEAMGLVPRGRRRARHHRGHDAQGRPAAGQPVRRPQVQGPPDRRHRRLDARARVDAVVRTGRRHAGARRVGGRPLQHGRRRRRQLRQHPRADQVGALSLPASEAPGNGRGSWRNYSAGPSAIAGLRSVAGAGATGHARHRLEPREAQARAELLAAGAQRKLGGARIGGHPQQRRQLARLADHAAQHRGDVGRSVRTQVDQRGRRQRPVRGIDDDPAGGERQAVGLRGLRRDMGFHVDGDARRGIAQRTLVGRLDHGGVDPGDVGVNGAAERLQQPPRPVAIGRIALVRRDDPRCHHPGAGGEVGRQPAGDAEADDAAGAARDRILQGRAQVRDMAVQDGDPGARRDPRFEGKAGHGDGRPRRRVQRSRRQRPRRRHAGAPAQRRTRQHDRIAPMAQMKNPWKARRPQPSHGTSPQVPSDATQ